MLTPDLALAAWNRQASCGSKVAGAMVSRIAMLDEWNEGTAIFVAIARRLAAPDQGL
jgi:hypothetical protein